MCCFGSPVMWLAIFKLYNYTAVVHMLACAFRMPLSYVSLFMVSGSVSLASLWPVAHLSRALTNSKGPFYLLFDYPDCKKELHGVYQIDRECFIAPKVV